MITDLTQLLKSSGAFIIRILSFSSKLIHITCKCVGIPFLKSIRYQTSPVIELRTISKYDYELKNNAEHNEPVITHLNIMRLLLISLAEGLMAVCTLNPFSRRFSRIFIIKNRVCIASVLSHQNGFPLISNS